MHLGEKLPGEASPFQLRHAWMSHSFTALGTIGNKGLPKKVQFLSVHGGQKLPREDQHTVLDIPVCNDC